MADPVSLPTNFLRLGSFPIDSTLVVSTYDQLTAYATNNPTAYAGQIVSVSNDAMAYIIRSDKSVLPLQTGSLSANWQSTFNLVNSNSANWNSNYSFVNLNSSNWNSFYSFYNTNSGLDLSVRTYVNSNSANINAVSSKVNSTSGKWDSVYSTYNTNSSFYATKQYTSDNFLALSGGYIIGDVSIGGNLFLLGSATQISTEDIVLTNSLFYLASGNPSDIVDIGFIGYTSSLNLGQKYVGLIRDAFTKKWVLFSNLSAISGSDININDPSITIDTLKANIEGNLVTNTNVFGDLSASGNVYGDNLKIFLWNDSFNKATFLSNNSSKYDSVFSNVNSNSGKYESVYSNINVLSSKWEVHNSLFNSNSGKYESVYNNINSLSGKWEAHNSLFNSNSGKYESVYSNVNSNSGKYESVYSNVNSNSGNWQSHLSITQNNSSFWNSNFSTVCALSSDWNSVYSQTLANSAFWQETYQTVQNNAGTIWNYQGTDLKALSGRWESNYTTYNTNSSLDLNARTYVNQNSSKFESVFSNVNSTSSTFATILFSDSKYIPLTSVDQQLNSTSTNTVTNSAVTNRILQIENSLNILVPAPTYTAPAATLTSFSPSTFEVGETVTRSLTLGYTQNDGGAATFYRLEKNSSLVQEQSTAFTRNVNETAVLGLTRYTCIVTHLSGAVKNNIIGLPDARGVITAGTKSINRDYNAYYKQFYGSVTTLPSTPALFRNLTGSNYTTTNSFTFYVYTRNIAIAIPSSKQLVSIITGSFENLTNQFSLSSTQVPDAGGALRDYKLYTYTTVNPYNSNFTITLS